MAERVWQELARGLMEAMPSRMFAVLRECGALAVLLPEVERLWGVRDCGFRCTCMIRPPFKQGVPESKQEKGRAVARPLWHNGWRLDHLPPCLAYSTSDA